MILFQGLEDSVVPPSQSEAIIAALQNVGVPYAYLPFPGEGHGFRQPSTIERALAAELSFYSQLLDIPIAETFEPVEIHNLSK